MFHGQATALLVLMPSAFLAFNMTFAPEDRFEGRLQVLGIEITLFVVVGPKQIGWPPKQDPKVKFL